MGNHYLHATHGGTMSCCSADSLITAENVLVGDTVFVAGEGMDALQPATVTTVDIVQRAGQYNFWLDQADDAHFRSLIVDGVAAVSFTDDFRLINTLGFDVADRMVDPLREMARAGISSRTRPSWQRCTFASRVSSASATWSSTSTRAVT